jgi:hypothetical protein
LGASYKRGRAFEHLITYIRKMTDDEPLTLFPTVIAGQRYADDHTVVWRGLPIGRIMRADGMPPHVPQWSWNCYVYGRPGGASGSGDDLRDCKAEFKGRMGRNSRGPVGGGYCTGT